MPRLRRSEPRGPGIQRVKSGRGFTFRGVDGKTVDAATRARIDALVIPPAWTEVWICPFPNGHIQATGRDAAGRTQYLYHEAWRRQKDRVKFERALELAASLPSARKRVTRDLRGDDPKLRTLAAAFRMLDAGAGRGIHRLAVDRPEREPAPRLHPLNARPARFAAAESRHPSEPTELLPPREGLRGR